MEEEGRGVGGGEDRTRRRKEALLELEDRGWQQERTERRAQWIGGIKDMGWGESKGQKAIFSAGT